MLRTAAVGLRHPESKLKKELSTGGDRRQDSNIA